MTDNKAALDALDNLYSAGMSVTREELCVFINTHGGTIRAALQHPEVDIEELKVECINHAFKDVFWGRNAGKTFSANCIKQTIDYLIKRNLIGNA